MYKKTKPLDIEGINKGKSYQEYLEEARKKEPINYALQTWKYYSNLKGEKSSKRV